MRKFKYETIIITKAAWKFMWNYEREKHGFKPCTDEALDRIWVRIAFRNGGANSKTHPISDDEIRVDPDSFNLGFMNVKRTLTENGFTFREDGFAEVGINL